MSRASFVSSLFVAAALAFSTLSCGGGGGEAKSPLMGAHAPSFEAEVISGDGPKTIKDAEGRVVILDFWGTFCEPCKKSFPKYQEIADQFPGQVAVIAASIDDPEAVKKDQILQFGKDHHAKFPIVWAKGKDAKDAYKLADFPGMPVCFILDKTGTVRFVHQGFRDGDEAMIAEKVKGLLGK